MNLQIGRAYGNYELIDVLDSSRDGTTYKVRNKLANRFEAMKVLPGNSQNDQDRVERFLREIRVHAGLTHPNIVNFYNATELEDRLVMTSELVEGTTLAARLELGPMPWREAVSAMNQVLSALAYAHERCIVHRDLTPARIILTPEGAARLNGFSLAKLVAEPNLTALGSAVGSLKYISPEQVKGIEQVDGRSDIYSAGVVLYEALTGKPPFNAKSQFELMSAHVNSIAPPPSALNTSVPKELDAVVLKAMAKDPSQRFQTATQFRMALVSTAIAQAATATQVSVAPVPPAPLLTEAVEPVAWTQVAGPAQTAAIGIVADQAAPPAVSMNGQGTHAVVAEPEAVSEADTGAAMPDCSATQEVPLQVAEAAVAPSAAAEPAVTEAPPTEIVVPQPAVEAHAAPEAPLAIETPAEDAPEAATASPAEAAAEAPVAEAPPAAEVVAESASEVVAAPPAIEVAAEPAADLLTGLLAAAAAPPAAEVVAESAAESVGAASAVEAVTASIAEVLAPPLVAEAPRAIEVVAQTAVEASPEPVLVADAPPPVEAGMEQTELVAALLAAEPSAIPDTPPSVNIAPEPVTSSAPPLPPESPRPGLEPQARPAPSAPPDLEAPVFEPIFAPLSAAPFPREVMLAAILFLVGIAAFFAFR